MRIFLIIALLISFVFAEDSQEISKIYIHSKDVFEDAVVHTPVEKRLYEFGNRFHINTKESVIRARLPFSEGDFISKEEIKEAEKNLRTLPYISDAKIEARKDSFGNTDLYIETSDNWTFAPNLSLGKPGEEWLYTIGLQESNLLGFGHTVGFFYEHQKDRNQRYLLYKSNDFLVPYHSLGFLWSENTDGFSRSLELGYPFISRAKNQWSYNAKWLWSKRDENFYESKNPKPIDTFEGVKEDSLSLWFLRSFGGASFKTYLGMGYDYHKIENGEWLDSRVGISIAASRIRLDKRYNLHRVKWAEDVEYGYYVKGVVAKNIKELNAINDDWFFEQKINLSLGTKEHYFFASEQSSFFYNNDSIRDMYSVMFSEYIFKPSLGWSSVLNAKMFSWQKNNYMRQLYLDGDNIFPGFPARYLVGKNTFAFKAEQRYFSKAEILAQIPSFAVFLTAGQATDSLRGFEPRDLIYMAGIGLRFSNSKAVQGVVNHVNLSWPLNGELKSFAPRFSFVGKVEL
jgi:hypothetical protein